MNSTKKRFFNLFSLRNLLFINIIFATLVHTFLLKTVKYNSMMSDDVRIIGEFFFKYLQSVGLEDKIKALFIQENEGYPGLIRFIYLLTYKLTGSTQFSFVGYLGNLFILLALFVQYKLLHFFSIPKHIYLVIPWVLINTHAFFTFFYSFESIFYISSVILPIYIFYLYFSRDNYISAISILFILSLFSSVYLIVGVLLLASDLFNKKWKRALSLILLISILYGCLNYFFRVNDGISREPSFYIQTLKSFGTILYLFFIQLGSWGFIFKFSPLLCSIIGFISLLFVIFILIGFFRKNETRREALFFSATFIFLWLLLLVNIIYRWEFDSSFFIPFLEQGHKAFFSLLYFTFFLIILYQKWPKKKLAYAMWGIFLLAYFIGLFYKYPSYLEVYKRRMLYSVNKTIRNADYAPFKETRQFERLGLLKNEPTWIEKQKKDLTKMINSNVQTDTDLQLNQFIPTNLPNNMYGKPTRFPVTLYSFDFEFTGNPLNHNDGLYYVFVSKNDTAIYPSQFKPNSIKKFILGEGPFAKWNICTIENVLTEELTEKQYAIYYFSGLSGVIQSVHKTNYTLTRSDTGYFLKK